MTRVDLLNFEIYVMDLCEECKTAKDYEKLSMALHDSVENAIQDMCMDNEIEDYEPCY